MVVFKSDMSESSNELLEENYCAIIKLMSEANISKEQVETIKKNFIDEIASCRRFEDTKTIRELLNLLEIRDVIGYDNITKLYDVAQKFDSSTKKELGKLLNRQSYWLSKIVPVVNLKYYADDSHNTGFSLSDAVTDCISSEVTRSWNRLARELQIIKENDIDQIEKLDDSLVNGISIRTKKCLEIYALEVQKQRLSNPYDTLLKALEIIGRRDVREMVEKLFQKYGI